MQDICICSNSKYLEYNLVFIAELKKAVIAKNTSSSVFFKHILTYLSGSSLTLVYFQWNDRGMTNLL